MHLTVMPAKAGIQSGRYHAPWSRGPPPSRRRRGLSARGRPVRRRKRDRRRLDEALRDLHCECPVQPVGEKMVKKTAIGLISDRRRYLRLQEIVKGGPVKAKYRIVEWASMFRDGSRVVSYELPA